jgi:hypothetical protein
MVAGSDPGQYGKLEMYVTPRNNPANGPSLASAQIDANQAISKQISLLNQQGSSVLLGNLLMIPVANSLLYIQPLYVQSSRNAVPELQDVIAAYGKNDQYASTLSQALSQVFQAPVSTAPSTGGTGTLSPQVKSLLDEAQAAYTQSQTDLKAGNLGNYQNDISSMEADLQEVQELTGNTSGSTTTTTAPTTGAAKS